MQRIALVATGGTIAGSGGSPTGAGYTAGTLSAESLLAAVPELAALAEIEVHQLFNLDSRDMTPAHWLALARKLSEVLARPEIAGAVVTHGTDTLEESAFFLGLVLPPGKPVVLTAAMRPATALSADGPANLYDACCVALEPQAAGLGVLATLGGKVWSARAIQKFASRSLDAFEAPANPPLATAQPWHLRHLPAHPLPRVALDLLQWSDLPRVDVLYAGAGSAPDLLAASLAAGARGIVLALPGNGSLPQAWQAAVGEARAAGIPVIRASRAASGGAGPAREDGEFGLIPAGSLPASKARVALMLALAGGEAP
ncbi:MAG: asparaginase, partial [Zoogloea sp.]|nr:asparaginase [Zoogloea sp.]